MIASRRGQGAADPDRARRILLRTLRGEEGEIASRSDYAGTLARLTRAVPEDKRIVAVFEEVTTPEGYADLCGRLGLTPVAPESDPAHVGQRMELSPDDRDRAAEWCRPHASAAVSYLGRRPVAWMTPV